MRLQMVMAPTVAKARESATRLKPSP